MLVVETLTRPPSQVYITLKHVAICWLPRTKESLPSLFTIHRNFAFSRTRPIRRPHFRLSWIIYTSSIYVYTVEYHSNWFFELANRRQRS